MFSEKYRYYCLLKTTDLSGKPVHRLLPTHNSCDTAVRCQRFCRLSSLVLHDVTLASRHSRSPLFTACPRYTSLLRNTFSAFFVRDFYHVRSYPYTYLRLTLHGLRNSYNSSSPNQSSSKRTDIILPTERHSVSK